MKKLLPNFNLSSFLSSSSPLASSVLSALDMIDKFLLTEQASGVSALNSRSDVTQHHLAAFACKLKHKELLDHLHAVDKERLRSMSSKGALAFLSAIPSSPELLIPSHLMPIVISSFLGAPFPLRQPHHCLCKKELDPDGLHLSLCNFRAPQHLHDMICSVLMDLARQAGSHVSPASSLLHLNPDRNTVPDFRISSSSPSEIDTVVDVQIRNPCAPSSFDSSGRPLSIASYAEQQKIEKHAAACAAAHMNFKPFVLERFGTLAPHASSLFNRLIGQIPPDIFSPPNWSARSASSYWHQRLSITLWGGSARELFGLWHRTRIADAR